MDDYKNDKWLDDYTESLKKTQEELFEKAQERPRVGTKLAELAKASGNEDFDLQEANRKYRIDVNKEILEPPKAVVFLDNLREIPVCTLGNISLVTGQAKARKTFLVSMMTAAAISSHDICGGLRGYLPKDKQNILYFDTEQGEYDAQQAIKKSLKLSNQRDPPQYNAYYLRECSTAERVKNIDGFINATENLGFVVIDGIRDLVNDINNPTECNEIVSKLMKWSSEKKCHIVCVLHLNKGDGKVRGHIGAELLNKSETVIKVDKQDKDPNVSIVSADYTRRMPFEPFAIYFNEETRMPDIDHDYLVGGVKKGKSKGTGKLLCHEINDAVHADRMIKVFEHMEPTFGEKLTSATIKDREYLEKFYPEISLNTKNLNHLPSYLVKIGVLTTNKEQEKDNKKWRFWISPKAKEMGHKKAIGEIPFN